MKTFVHNLTNAFKTIKLLSNPEVSAYLEAYLQKAENTKTMPHDKLAKNSVYYHKHYLVQVVH